MKKSSNSKTSFGIELAFTTKSIESDFKRAIQAGATQIAGIEQKPWGQKVAYLRDVNGFLIDICTPIKN